MTRNVPAATARVGPWLSPSFPKISTRRAKIPLSTTAKPKILSACPRIIDRATPFRKPTKMGLDKKSASAPRRRKLAAIHINPVSKASISDREA
jgi:hypothetical protein